MAQTPAQRKSKQRQANRDLGLVRYHLKELWVRPETVPKLDLEFAKAIAKAIKSTELGVVKFEIDQPLVSYCV